MKGSYTVEAAFVGSLLCVILCLMLSMTLALYERVAQYGEESVSTLEEIRPTSELLRMERVAGDLWDRIKNQ